MTTFLLDANVLIALTARDHVHHERVRQWASAIEQFALCPITEGALTRFMVRVGLTSTEAQRMLVMIADRPGYLFWSDDLSYADVPLSHVRGHRQVTDAYLVALAASKPNALLAAMDRPLTKTAPEGTLLVPEG